MIGYCEEEIPLEVGCGFDFWWHTFNDTTLDYLVFETIENNYDLQVARERIFEARAMVKAAASDLLPDVTFSATRQNFRFPENGILPVGALAQTGLIKEGDAFYDLGFDTQWEIDLFGANRNQVVAAKQRVCQTIENRKELMISLIAEVVRYYIELRRDQQLLAILNERRALQQQLVDDYRAKEKSGLISEIDLNSAIMQEKEIEADRVQYIASLRILMNRLAVLSGKAPKTLDGLLAKSEPYPSHEYFNPGEVSAEIICRRPDVKAKEYSLKAQVALVKSAKGRLMPNFLLFALTRLQSMTLSDLFAQGSRWWFMGPFANWKIFERYELKANFDREVAKYKQSCEEYTQKILEAYEEIGSVYREYEESINRQEALAAAEAVSNSNVKLTENLFNTGLKGYTELLQARLNNNVKRENRIKAEAKTFIDKVRLHKSLGGGWKALPPVS